MSAVVGGEEGGGRVVVVTGAKVQCCGGGGGGAAVPVGDGGRSHLEVSRRREVSFEVGQMGWLVLAQLRLGVLTEDLRLVLGQGSTAAGFVLGRQAFVLWLKMGGEAVARGLFVVLGL